MLMPNFDNLEVELVRDNIYKIITPITYMQCGDKRCDDSIGYTVLGDGTKKLAYFITEGIGYETGKTLRELGESYKVPNYNLFILSDCPDLGGLSLC